MQKSTRDRVYILWLRAKPLKPPMNPQIKGGLIFKKYPGFNPQLYWIYGCGSKIPGTPKNTICKVKNRSKPVVPVGVFLLIRSALSHILALSWRPSTRKTRRPRYAKMLRFLKETSGLRKTLTSRKVLKASSKTPRLA